MVLVYRFETIYRKIYVLKILINKFIFTFMEIFRVILLLVVILFV